MISLKILLCAEGVIRDADSNKMSVFNLIESSETAGFPLLYPTFCVFALLERGAKDPQKANCSVQLKHRDDELVSAPITIDFQDKLRNRSTVQFHGLVVTAPGTLTATWYHEGKPMATYEIAITKAGQPEVVAKQA